jgi:chaperonin GroES
MKEQSSTSSQEIHKNKLGLEDKYKKQHEDLPRPTGWRLLVLPYRIKDKTKGGIVLAESTLEKQQVASQCGLILAMGPQCYQDKERYPEGPWCKVGEWVMFARYAGSRIKIEGGEIRLLNDDEILATIKSPQDLLHEF